MKRTFIFLSTFVVLLAACNNRNSEDRGKPGGIVKPIEPPIELPKPNLKVYVENSGSMNGYVKGVTDFEQSVYNYLTDIKISNLADSLSLYYINSNIIPQGSDISDFIEKLEPNTFQAKGGNLGISDISNVLKSVLSETKENEIAILVTDGIFSPGKGKNAAEYLVNQLIGIKKTMAEHLSSYPNTATVIYQLSSQFEGFYYRGVL
ncbi:MAG: hypothetical protein Q7J05_09220 [Paludibacter sp.]|nr:hypothetical protein [Paludibacter sp.]